MNSYRICTLSAIVLSYSTIIQPLESQIQACKEIDGWKMSKRGWNVALKN